MATEAQVQEATLVAAGPVENMDTPAGELELPPINQAFESKSYIVYGDLVPMQDSKDNIIPGTCAHDQKHKASAGVARDCRDGSDRRRDGQGHPHVACQRGWRRGEGGTGGIAIKSFSLVRVRLLYL